MIENASHIHRGRCLCGAIHYEVEGPPLVVAHCHCDNCQRGSGSGHSTGAMFPADKLRLSGLLAEYHFKSDKGNHVTRAFCPVCGSPIPGRNSGMTGFVTIALGILDDHSAFKPDVVVFARGRQPWDKMDDGLPAFESQPDWKPEDGL